MLIADLICVFLNLFQPVTRQEAGFPPAGEFLALLVLILFNILAVFNIRDLIRNLAMWHKEKISWWSWEYLPVGVGVYLLGNLTAVLIIQFHLESAGLYFNFAYILLALGFISYGFIKRFAYIRWLGLGLILFTLTKLFLFDLSYLPTFSKIVAYFGFGFILLAISLLYQKIQSLLEEKNVRKDQSL